MPPGQLVGGSDQTFEFAFTHNQKDFDSYGGKAVRLRYVERERERRMRLCMLLTRRSLLFYTRRRYFVKATLQRKGAMSANVAAVRDFCVQVHEEVPEVNPKIKMEVGIEDSLHIEFEFLRSKFALNDVVQGKVYFELVALPIERMELSVLRKETVGAGASATTETTTVGQYEIMYGCPVRGESIPVRLFLGGLKLTPSYTEAAHGRFTVSYVLHLLLEDASQRRYYKSSPITLFSPAPTVEDA